MKQVTARKNLLLLHPDGSIHYPYSKFVSDEYVNPHTRARAAQAMRIFYRFCVAHRICLLSRMKDGLCLTYSETKKLIGLMYRPLNELELLSDQKVVSLNTARATHEPWMLPKAVEPNTALKRILHIARFLDFYLTVFLLPNIKSRALKATLSESYGITTSNLRTAIKATNDSHHLDIQSLPSSKFLEIIRQVVLRPERLFLTRNGKIARNWQRNRAIVLLACEGLRPGSIANLGRSDFQAQINRIHVVDNRHKRPKVTTSTPVLKLGDINMVTSPVSTIVEVWPFTTMAINEYIAGERQRILSKGLKNKSCGLLFLSEDGGPIEHRGTINAIFRDLETQLNKLGLLDVHNDPYFRDSKTYEFFPYVLRHSNASLYVEKNGTESRNLDSMKKRFGWKDESKQPARYAARALSDLANIKLVEFFENLTEEIESKRGDK